MASANRVPTKILNIFQYYYIIMLLVLNAAESEESREKTHRESNVLQSLL